MGVDINQYIAAIETFLRSGPYKSIRKYEKECKNEKYAFQKWFKFLVLISVGFAFSLTELNNSGTLSICIKDKHNLSSVLHTFGGKTFEGRSINY